METKVCFGFLLRKQLLYYCCKERLPVRAPTRLLTMAACIAVRVSFHVGVVFEARVFALLLKICRAEPVRVDGVELGAVGDQQLLDLSMPVPLAKRGGV